MRSAGPVCDSFAIHGRIPLVKHRPRKTRRTYNEPGHAHYLTYSCYHGYPLLLRDRSRGWVIDAIEQARTKLNFDLWAYVIMPEHVHVLLCPRAKEYDMRRILAGLKYPVARAAHRWLEENDERAWLRRLTVTYPSRCIFHFWQQGGGFDHNVIKEKTLPAIVDYIHANPVRLGLVAQAEDWTWSSARFYEGCPDVPLKLDDLPA